MPETRQEEGWLGEKDDGGIFGEVIASLLEIATATYKHKS